MKYVLSPLEQTALSRALLRSVDTTNDWRDVPGYEGLYKVHRDGRVLSMGREIEGVRRGTPCIIRYKQKLMTPQRHGRGHQAARVALFKGDGVAHRDVYICDLVRAVFGGDAAAALPDMFRKRNRAD